MHVFMYVHVCVHMGAEVSVECLPQGLFLNQELTGLVDQLAN